MWKFSQTVDAVLGKERTDRQIGSEGEGWQEPRVAADTIAGQGSQGRGFGGPLLHPWAWGMQTQRFCLEGRVGLEA